MAGVSISAAAWFQRQIYLVDFRYKPIPSAGYGLNKFGRLCVVVKGLAKLPDVKGDVSFFDETVGPDFLQQRLFSTTSPFLISTKSISYIFGVNGTAPPFRCNTC